jgi:hypothetical protein
MNQFSNRREHMDVREARVSLLGEKKKKLDGTSLPFPNGSN